MKWYFCFNDRVSDYFRDMIRACVNSARLNTSLEMNCLYDGVENSLTQWLTKVGVNVVRTQVHFVKALESAETIAANGGNGYDPHAARGFYLPLQIHRVETTTPFVLFTDVDVIFTGDVQLDGCRPKILAACGEVADMRLFKRLPTAADFNSGVMVLNLEAMRRREQELMAVLHHGHFYRDPSRPGATYDQWALNAAFGTEWERLDDRYNWRAYWEPNHGASIVHFHGPKPGQILRLLGGEAETLDATSRDMVGRFSAQYEASLALYKTVLPAST